MLIWLLWVGIQFYRCLGKLEENQSWSSLRQAREDNVGFTGKVELGVIHKTMKVNVIFLENLTNEKELNKEEEGLQDKALGHTQPDK